MLQKGVKASLQGFRLALIQTSGKTFTVQTFSATFKQIDAQALYHLSFSELKKLVSSPSSHVFSKIKPCELSGVIKRLHDSIHQLAIECAEWARFIGRRR